MQLLPFVRCLELHSSAGSCRAVYPAALGIVTFASFAVYVAAVGSL